jgi:hypothetical protein
MSIPDGEPQHRGGRGERDPCPRRRILDRLLEVRPGKRVSDLERWRKGPPPRGSGPAIIVALDQVAEIQSLGLVGLGAELAVPPRRLGELVRYGMTADAWLIRRHPDARRLATGRPAGRPAARAGVGRRHGRRGQRDAVRCSRPGRVRPPE